MSANPTIDFHYEYDFELSDEETIRQWLIKIAGREQVEINELNYIFLSDEELLDINRSYLGHDFYTDIITFPLHEKGEPIEADIYISVDRVKDNAREFNTDFEQELMRVIAHGLLHLCGYSDKTSVEQELMTKKEEECIALYS